MEYPSNVLMVSAECVPFAKTGGLGDVTGALPGFLKKAGLDARIIIPLYSFIDKERYGIKLAFEGVKISQGGETFICDIYETLTQNEVPVYFLDYRPFFERENIYHDSEFNDYHDNPKRFMFLSRAAPELCRLLNFKPDIIHVNDWHTSILPAWLKRLFNNDPLFSSTASVLTIHNIAYQGRYAGYYYGFTGLGEEDFTSDKFECFNAINLLKGGIHFADMVNTVSKGYAAETRTPEGGHGLDHYLNKRGDEYVGILNGVDYSEWNPESDTLIPASYSSGDMNGKGLCKSVLQREFGLNHDPAVPVIGIVGRLVEQKGFYLLAGCIEDILNNFNVQFVILGSGDKQLETYFGTLPVQFPGRVGSYIGYSNEKAHLIEAGSDFFLMPSLFEPCGLNQIYSLKYGTLPIVRATGGLDDTVENYNQNTGDGTGFKFREPLCKAIYDVVKIALLTYFNRKHHLIKLINNAMKQNFSWEDSAAEYIKLYSRALESRRAQ
ncbi:MAG: glycogen synthase [Bacteroidales bacterium]|nr:glycogen synthase [Bacteroidales bacterium]